MAAGILLLVGAAVAQACAPAAGDLLVADGGAGGPDRGGARQEPDAAPAGGGGGSWVIVAAGDISCRGCAQQKTAALIGELGRGGRLAAILPLGDVAYPNGTLAEFQRNYAPAWGVPDALAITRPVPGNHEYARSAGDGYFDYYDGPGRATGIAGARGQGYYSYDVGTWHLVALNSSDGCHAVPCAVGSAQERWLAADLAAHPAGCSLAYWHHPRFQGGTEGGETDAVAPLWNAFDDAGGDVVLTAHEHNYQQLAPLARSGAPDPARGIRSFVIGTGGAGFHSTFGAAHEGAIEARAVGTHGVLELTLRDGGYRWRFVAVDGTVPDGASGTASCH